MLCAVGHTDSDRSRQSLSKDSVWGGSFVQVLKQHCVQVIKKL